MLFASVSQFLIARLLSAALAIGSVIIFFFVAARLSKSERLAVILASLFASAPLMLLADGSARNDIMPIFFGLCGVWFTLCGLDAERKQYGGYLALFFAGLCMALAVGAKITAAFIPLSALLCVFLRARQKLLPLILGGALGSLPIVYYAAAASDKFLYCNVTFHLTAPKELYIDMQMQEILTWPYRVKFMVRTWAGEPALVMATLFIAFLAFAAWRRGALLRTIGTDRIFIILLMVAAIPFVFLPNPAGKQYLQPAIPYVLLSWAALYPLAQRIVEPRQIRFFANIAVALVAMQAGRFVIEAVRLNNSQWTVTQVHDFSVLIAHHVKEGPVATLYPTLVLDAGSPVYPQFATAFFFFLSGNHLAPKRVVELNGISASTLPLLLSVKPPAAVLIGTTSGYERPLLNWAKWNCYMEVDISPWQGRPYHVDIWKPRLFVRPDETGACRIGRGRASLQPRS